MIEPARIKSRVLAIAAAYPFVWLACFYLLVLRTRFAVGHWPHHAHPDPKHTGLDIHYSLLVWGMLALPFIGLGASSFGLWCKLRTRDISWPLVLGPALSVVATVVYLSVDPGKFWDWFLD